MANSVPEKPLPPRDVGLVLHPERDAEYVHFENAAGHPFLPAATVLGRRNAWWLADAALLAYWSEAEVKRRSASAGMDAVLLDCADVQCSVAWTERFAIVAFRGTQPDRWRDLLDDAAFALVPWGDGRAVHQGFKGALERIWPALVDTVAPLLATRSLWFAGHSLGAALATLAADRFDATRGICTVGSPRVGDAAFATAFNARFGGRSLRYVDGADVVTHVPPPHPYEHVDLFRQIAGDGSVSSAPPRLAHFFADLLGDAKYLAEMVALLDRRLLGVAPAFLLDHMPRAYAVRLWNDYARNGD